MSIIGGINDVGKLTHIGGSIQGVDVRYPVDTLNLPQIYVVFIPDFYENISISSM